MNTQDTLIGFSYKIFKNVCVQLSWKGCSTFLYMRIRHELTHFSLTRVPHTWCVYVLCSCPRYSKKSNDNSLAKVLLPLQLFHLSATVECSQILRENLDQKKRWCWMSCCATKWKKIQVIFSSVLTFLDCFVSVIVIESMVYDVFKSSVVSLLIHNSQPHPLVAFYLRFK